MRIVLIIASMLFMTIACSTKSKTTMETTRIFPLGMKAEDNFTGETHVQMLTIDGQNFDAISYNVTFAAGSRTDWHSHPGGQILYCTYGEGRYQEKGKPIQHLKVGDVVEIKPDVVHWHGAAPDHEFVHLGISTQLSKGPAEWLGSVTDEEYNKL